MKNLPEQRPKYSLHPIRSLSSLSLSLGIPEEILQDIAIKANSLYRKAKPIAKLDGSIRQPFDAIGVLKDIQRRIKDSILKKVDYPQYLTGSLKGRDYRVNAEMHTASRIVICEDITNFFPATTSEVVKNIWLNLFNFSDDVSEVLTKLTTKDGAIPQGAITSSYLANLVFWDCEPYLRENFFIDDVIYSRYVDDITVSSKKFLINAEKTQIIAQIYGMLAKNGYKAKRRKHEIFTSGDRMVTTKLIVNKKLALPNKERKNIRAAVYALEKLVMGGERGEVINMELNRVTSRVGRLGRFHSTESLPLKQRVKTIREHLKDKP